MGLLSSSSVDFSLNLSFLLCEMGIIIVPASKINKWASLVAQWLRVRLPVQGTRV